MKRSFGFICMAIVFCLFTWIGGYADGNGTGDEEMAVLNGTVKYVGIEGGCWLILDDEGNSYEPINLAKEYEIDGLPVEVKMKRRNDYSTVCQMGYIVEIISISKRFRNK